MGDRFIWTLTWSDETLSAACTDLRAGIVGATRTVLVESREQKDFTRRAYASALLGSIAADSDVAELWVKDEPHNPDAYLLLARVHVNRMFRLGGPGGPFEATALRLMLKAERASERAAELWSEDPTPWLVRLSLEPLRLRRPVLPSEQSQLGALPGPWDLVEREIWPRDPFNREAGHRLLAYFSPRCGGSNAEMDQFVTWVSVHTPRDSPLQLLPLAAELDRVRSIDADVQDEIARQRRVATLHSYVAETEAALSRLTTDRSASGQIQIDVHDLRSQRDRLIRELAEAEKVLAEPPGPEPVRRFLRSVAMGVYARWFLNIHEEHPVKLPRSLPLSDLMCWASLGLSVARQGPSLPVRV